MTPQVSAQVLLCVFLFSVALFITTVIAKLLASYFHKQAFFDKMQATLTQVRQRPWQAAGCVTHVTSSPDTASAGMPDVERDMHCVARMLTCDWCAGGQL